MKATNSTRARYAAIFICSALIAVCARAQTQDARGAEDELTRLTQEYMAKRAEWVALRAREMERAKQAKETKSRAAILQKLDEDERVLRNASADLATRVREAQKNRKGGK